VSSGPGSCEEIALLSASPCRKSPAGRWAMSHVPDVRRRAKNGAQPLTTNLSADSVSEGNGESEDDQGKNESNQDFHSEISVSVDGA